MLTFSARSGQLARIELRPQMSIGPVVVGTGLLVARAAQLGGYLTFVLPAVIVFGIGLVIRKRGADR